ncbi:formylglycine-generating enzyme family protein [Methylomonas sp. 2BW1-5-20]|uniref:formylglycine-generating enzyme family protein n=1 Tax=Methylomonas sp. 2BW1-5-20 TaxID=3376686 RepID=UPI00405315E6
MTNKANAWSRLALVEAAGEDDAFLENLANHFGYFKHHQVQLAGTLIIKGPIFSGKPAIVFTSEAEVRRPPALFPRILSIEKLETRHEDTQKPAFLSDPRMVLRPEDSPPGTYSFEPPQPLLPPCRLLPLLFNALNRPKSSHKLDTRQLVRRIARGQPLQKIQKSEQARWPQRLLIIVDASTNLEPYWADFVYWVGQLQALLGQEAVEAIRFDEESLGEPCSYASRWPGKAEEPWFVWQPPAVDVAVLIFSDLGEGDSRRAVRWRRQLACLNNHTAPVLTLSPAASSDANTLDWLCPNPYNDQVTPRHPYRNGFKLDGRAPDWEGILAWLSALPLVDAGLFRRLRQELNWGDSALETAIWNHPEVRHIGLGIRLQEAVAEKYRLIYRQRLAGSKGAETFWQCVTSHHHNAYAGLKHLESLNRCWLEDTEDPVMREYFQRLCKTALDETTDIRHQALFQQQCRTVLDSRPKQLWQSSLGELLYPIYAAAHADRIRAGEWPAELEPGFQPERLAWLIGSDAPDSSLVAWNFVQIGSQGELQCQQARDTNPDQRYLFQIVAPKFLPPRLIHKAASTAIQQTLADGAKFSIPENESVAIEAGNFRYRLDAIRKPTWASCISLSNADSRAARLSVSISWVGRQFDNIGWYVTEQNKGCWSLPTPFGEDVYGLYADLTVNNVTQRFRWIEPGSYMMGSPPDEAERYDKETQHPVTLSQGFWLADTTVTQAFWLVLMGGDNPSYFQDSPEHPVEQVSWDDAQRFVETLNAEVSGLSAQLPSEAQWEYACRAGTTTPFSFGDNISPEQVNYDGNSPYAGAKKGVYREKTVPVKSLPANPWGLYEMHGNLWEWCQDVWQKDLGSAAAVDPLTRPDVDTGGARVLRGGSWRYDGRYVRSSIRNHYEPDYRRSYIGFRLALGQPELKPGRAGGAVKLTMAQDAPGPDSGVAEQSRAELGGFLRDKVLGKGRKKK